MASQKSLIFARFIGSLVGLHRALLRWASVSGTAVERCRQTSDACQIGGRQGSTAADPAWCRAGALPESEQNYRALLPSISARRSPTWPIMRRRRP